MKLTELKKILTPFIKDLIKEILLEEKGILSHIINESIVSAKKELLYENKSNSFNSDENFNDFGSPKTIYNNRNSKKKEEKSFLLKENRIQEVQKELLEHKKQLMNAMVKTGNENLKNVFENIDPISSSNSTENSSNNQIVNPLSIYPPNDSGIDISQFFSKR